MNIEDFELKYIVRLKDIRKCRENESLNDYIRRCWREEALLPVLPIDLLYSEAYNLKNNIT